MAFDDASQWSKTGLFLMALAAAAGTAGCGGEPGREGDSPAPGTLGSETIGDSANDLQRPHEGTEEDWQIFRSKVSWAWEQGLDTVPMGEAMVKIALTFVGDPYVPGTLELDGPEDVVVNLEAFDCVTLVENVLALARVTRLYGPEILDSDDRMRSVYRGALREIRYRGARVDGYPSRLHYFSDWISDNESKGLIREITKAMGGEEYYQAIDYMTTHSDSYPQLADPRNLRAVADTEAFLSGQPLFRLPEGDILERASGIQDGDIIAATSTVDGLDVAHTGLAYWQGSALHLLHAPLVGEVVEVSDLPLGERILRLQGQDGIRVVRPVDPVENVPEGAAP